MARGKDAHRAEVEALAALGKDLSRRAGSACELCGARDGCRPHAVPPLGEDGVDVSTAILACPRCREAIDARRLPGEPAEYRFLETAVWSEIAPAQVAAVRLLRRLAADAPWAQELNDGLWLDDAIAERVEAT